MANPITFKIGQRQHFVATRTFTLGKTGVSVPRGSDIMYDGSVAEFGGSEYPVPEMRGAVKAGWMVPGVSYDEDDHTAEMPQPAGIQFRPAEGGNPMNRPQMTPVASVTESDEHEVGNTRSHARAVSARNTGHRPGTPVSANPGSTAELQDGVPVRRLKTASGTRAQQTRTVITSESAGSAISAASNVQIDAGQGITEGEMLDRMTPEAQEEYLAAKDSKKAQYVDTEPVVVGRIKSREPARKEAGMTATLSLGKGATEIYDASGTDPGKAKIAHVEQDGIRFTTTNGPSGKEQASPRAGGAPVAPPVVLREGSADVRRMVARQLCPDFPSNYDFTLAPRKKLARLQADYEDRTDVLRAVFAAEGDEFKATLMQEFPQAFSQ